MATERQATVDNQLRLTVGGYKSIVTPLTLEVKPLTIIAGANSSGKSSFLQPFLLLKQTIDASFGAGPLLLHGPNVRLTRWDQAISRSKSRSTKRPNLEIAIERQSSGIRNRYEWAAGEGIKLRETTFQQDGQEMRFHPSMESKEVERNLSQNDIEYLATLRRVNDSVAVESRVVERDGFLQPETYFREESGMTQRFLQRFFPLSSWYAQDYVELVASIMHVPGLRGNPERSYVSSSVGGVYAGTMEQYVASLLDSWQNGNDSQKELLRRVAADLEDLGLTWKVTARRLDDVQLELLVGRLPHPQKGGARDLVNIADVGFGVSQALPVIVSLHAAAPGQVIYIEQPELHLHPRAQSGIARALVAAANRGILVVAETHSALVIRAIQTAVAKREISPANVSLNWLSRDPLSGYSKIDSAEIDEEGRFGDWPLDFDEVAEQADWDFMTASGS